VISDSSLISTDFYPCNIVYGKISQKQRSYNYDFLFLPQECTRCKMDQKSHELCTHIAIIRTLSMKQCVINKQVPIAICMMAIRYIFMCSITICAGLHTDL